MSTQYAKDQPEGFVNYIQNVAIVGASGQLGRHFTEHLLKTGKHSITAVTRKESNAKFPDEIKVAPVDYDDEESLVSALSGHDALIITLAFTPKGDEIHDKLVRSAAKAGIKYLVPNIYTSDVVFNNQALGDEILIGSAMRKTLSSVESVTSLSWTVLVTGLWYEFSLACPPAWLGFDLNNRKVTLFDDGKRRINMSTWPQQGRAIAAFLSLKKLPENEDDKSTTIDSFRNKPLYVSSFLVNQRDALDSLQRVTKTTDADWDISYESTSERVALGREELSTGNMRGLAKAYYSRLHYPGSEGVFEDKLDNEKLGLPKEDLDEATKVALALAETGWTPDGQ